MEIKKAKEIVSLLADGVDPTTGELFPDDSPYNQPLVIRALFTILNNTKPPKATQKSNKKTKPTIKEKQENNIASGKPKNSGLPWDEESKIKVSTMHSEGKSIKELAKYFERSEGAIKSELEHQGVIG